MLLNMKDLLAVANEHKFAVPAFNFGDYNMLNGVISASVEKNAPVIIALHPNELRHLGGAVMRAVLDICFHSPIPTCIHLDHGANFADVIYAIQCGFTSVMIDGSALPFDENIAVCKKAAEAAHAVNVSIEGELGTIGTLDNEAEAGAEIIYTDPDDAKEFVNASGVDTLAIAIGTSHGLYPKGMVPELKLELLRQIKAKTPIPLVLHGGSGIPDAQISKAVALGVNKINISSDIKDAYYRKMREVLRDQRLREPGSIQLAPLAALKEVACLKIDLFRASGKASLY